MKLLSFLLLAFLSTGHHNNVLDSREPNVFQYDYEIHFQIIICMIITLTKIQQTEYEILHTKIKFSSGQHLSLSTSK
jgi:hypothetical protein